MKRWLASLSVAMGVGAVAWGLPLGLRFAAWGARDTGLSAKDYIQDGLVAMWDGIENAGWGKHDENATEWVDLVGGVGDMELNPDCIDSLEWTTNSFIAHSCSNVRWRARVATPFYVNHDMTLDGCMIVITNGTWWYRAPLGVAIPAGQGVLLFGRGYPYTDISITPVYSAYYDIPNTGSIKNKLAGKFCNATFACDLGKTNFCGYINGDYMGMVTRDSKFGNYSFADQFNSLTNIALYVGVGFTQYNDLLSVDTVVHGLRIYNRLLTAEEIKHNYEVDKARFGTAVDAAE